MAIKKAIAYWGMEREGAWLWRCSGVVVAWLCSVEGGVWCVRGVVVRWVVVLW